MRGTIPAEEVEVRDGEVAVEREQEVYLVAPPPLSGPRIACRNVQDDQGGYVVAVAVVHRTDAHAARLGYVSTAHRTLRAEAKRQLHQAVCQRCCCLIRNGVEVAMRAGGTGAA
eukprot:565985-Rhodomonas_salina.2